MKYSSIVFTAFLISSATALHAQEDLSDCEDLISATATIFNVEIGGAVATETQKAFCDALQTFAEKSSKRLAEAEARIAALQLELVERDNNIRSAVVAFDRSEGPGACPNGWSIYRAAGGRAIIGAGEHSNSGVSKYPAFADNPNTATGGEETVTLTVSQMPSHSHERVGFPAKDEAGGYGVGITGGFQDRLIVTGRTRSSSKVGESQPHNNMPPFIALYFCKKD